MTRVIFKKQKRSPIQANTVFITPNFLVTVKDVKICFQQSMTSNLLSSEFFQFEK